jgi:hypothetical protein
MRSKLIGNLGLRFSWENFFLNKVMAADIRTGEEGGPRGFGCRIAEAVKEGVAWAGLT